MHCLSFLLALNVAALGVASVHAAPENADLFGRRAGTNPSPTLHIDLRIPDSLKTHNALRGRDGTSEQSSVTCPEEIGAQPLPCSVDVCGGVDPINAGHCLKEKCQCGTDTIASPILTTVTASQSGKTVTASYALQTITSYSGLRQAITTTVTASTTGTDGSTGIETGAAVIFAGGAAWFLAGYVGDAQACSPPTKFSISDYSDRCTKLLTQVLEDPDACPGNTGGNVKEEAADHGCVTWHMFQWSLP